MKLHNLDALGRLSVYQNSIVLSYSGDITEIQQQILSQLDVDIGIDPFFDITKKIVTICPVSQNKAYEYHFITEQMRTALKGYKPKIVVISDFRNSDDLYDLCKGKNSKFKVLSDQFSIRRASVLFQYISEFESDIKKAYIKTFNVDDIADFDRYKRKDIDHKLLQLDLFELIEKEMSSLSGDSFFLDKLKRSSDDANLIHARKLTKLDEMNLGVSNEELSYFRDIRNKVMHFKVVRYSEVLKALDINNRLQLNSISKLFSASWNTDSLLK